jgi:mannitol/fructose-specific phosphotransferase system IIA component (Ntr-type)
MENFLTVVEVARCLGLSIPETEKVLRKSGLRCAFVSGTQRFQRDELLHWLEVHFGSLTVDRLRTVDYSNASTAGLDPSKQYVSGLLEGNIHPMVAARTRSSLLRSLAGLACATGLTWDEAALYDQICEREDAVSTALSNGVAFPHPREIRKIYLEGDVLILARTPSPIPFGAPGGRLSGLFFLLLFPSPSVHLHVLARLSRMVREEALVRKLCDASDEAEMLDAIRSAESGIVSVTAKDSVRRQ